MDKTKKITVVTPCFNEEEGIREFFKVLHAQTERLAQYRWEVLFVDDGSTDGTLNILNDISKRYPHVQVISFARNFGHQVALRAGLEYAECDAVIMMDSDLQHPPELLSSFISKWEEGHDIVSAIRKDTEGVGWLKKFTSWSFYRILGMISDIELTPGVADFCLISNRAQQALLSMPERHLFIRGMLAWIGLPRTFVKYTAAERLAGRSKYTFRKMIRFAFDAVFSFSISPVRNATRVGMAIGAFAAAYLVYALVVHFATDTVVPGWTSLIAITLLLGGVQITFIGILGEYLGRIFEQVKKRPLFVLKQLPPKLTTRAYQPTQRAA